LASGIPSELETPYDELHRVITVELPNAANAEDVTQELRDLFPAASIKEEDSLHVAVWGLGAQTRLIAEVLGAVQLWLNEHGTAPVLVEVGDKTYLLEAHGRMERLGAAPN
jgi:hypothetical protein